MKISNFYEYKPLTRVTHDNGKREYVTPDGDSVPSVTTIISATAENYYLESWRKRVGDEEADRISKESSDIGSLMHQHIENHILGVERPYDNPLPDAELSARMADLIIKGGLSKVDEVWGIEAGLYFPKLYAGTTDLVGVHDGEPAIMDHKSSKLMKSLSQIDGYFMQGCAYAMAHNDVYKTDINKIVIFMASRDEKYKEFSISGDKFHKYCDKWCATVDKFLRSSERK